MTHVTTPQERGARGHAQMVANTTAQQRREWALRGGRKPNRTLAQIEAAAVPERARPDRKKGGKSRSKTAGVTTRFE